MDGPDDIYDIVSEELKEAGMMEEAGEEGIFEDIYDVPEGKCMCVFACLCVCMSVYMCHPKAFSIHQ